jgi:hypothetical protein
VVSADGSTVFERMRRLELWRNSSIAWSRAFDGKRLKLNIILLVAQAVGNRTMLVVLAKASSTVRRAGSASCGRRRGRLDLVMAGRAATKSPPALRRIAGALLNAA